MRSFGAASYARVVSGERFLDSRPQTSNLGAPFCRTLRVIVACLMSPEDPTDEARVTTR